MKFKYTSHWNSWEVSWAELSRATFELLSSLRDVPQTVPEDDSVEEHRGREGDVARGHERLGPSQLRVVHRQDGAPAPCGDCPGTEDRMSPAYPQPGEKAELQAEEQLGGLPPARHGAGHRERRHLAHTAPHGLHQHREVPQQPGDHQHLGFSPHRSQDIQPGPACVVLFLLCTQRAETRKTCFRSRRKCKLK